MGRKTNTMGATPAILAATTAVCLTTMFAGVMGLWPFSSDQVPTASALAPQAEAVDLPAVEAARSAPARTVITTLLGADVRWGATIPVPFGCQVATPILSGQAGAVTVHVFGAGLGGLVAEQLDRCGASIKVSTAPGSDITLTGGHLITWTRGDVLVTVASTSGPGQAETDLDAALVNALGAAACPDLNPTAADATRNPTHGGYVQYTHQVTVTAPADPAGPVLGAQPAPLTGPTPIRRALPTGLTGPPLPVEVARPVPPTWPGLEPLTADVRVPLLDVIGPGCGWDFTGSVPPGADSADLAAQTTALTATKKAELVAAQAQWTLDATAYVAADAAYEPLVAPWLTYIAQVGAVTDSWSVQSAALAAYNDRVAAYNAATGPLQAWFTDRAATQGTYDAAVSACTAAAAKVVAAPAPGAAPASGPGPTPTSSATPDLTPSVLTCPVPRPASFDQTPPVVPPVPVPPMLWTAPAP